MGRSVTKLALLASSTALAGTLGLGGAGGAFADNRQPAPVVFAGPDGTGSAGSANAAQGTARPPASVATQPASGETSPEARASARIAFVYPGAAPASPAAEPEEARAPTRQTPAETPRQTARVTVPAVTPPPPAPATRAVRPAVPDTQAAKVLPDRIQPVAGPVFDEVGMASWYGEAFHGKPTANGEIFDMEALTAAHPNLPLPSLVQVVNLENNREVVVRVNDRGPFAHGRILDLSRAAARALDFIEAGETRVRIRYLGPAPVGGAAGPASVPPRQPASEASPAPAPEGDGPLGLRDVSASAPVARPQVPSRAAATTGAPSLDFRHERHEAPAGRYYVQLGAFADPSNAERLKLSLAASLPVDVQPARVNGADFFRVLVGPWPDERRAEAVQTDLAARNFGPGLLVSRP